MENTVSREKIIKGAVLELLEKGKSFAVADILHALDTDVNRVYVSRILANLVKDGVLAKGGVGKGTRYAAAGHQEQLPAILDKTYDRELLQEHLVLDEIRSKPFWNQLSDNARSVIDFSLSEMVNNAIDHSESKKVQITVQADAESIRLNVKDAGIGVFRNVMQKKQLSSPYQAIQDILKGKTTTVPKIHTGEGIFFTSKAVNFFQLQSYGMRLIIDNTRNDVFVITTDVRKSRGTEVSMRVDKTNATHLTKLFQQFTLEDDASFSTTEIDVSLYQYGTVHISRSQARRILSGLDKFKKIILDFHEVPTVGQGFADEIFRVFQSQHPDIVITYKNAVPAVEFMIERAKSD